MAAANDANHLMAPMMTGALNVLVEGTALALALAARQLSVGTRVGGPKKLKGG
jgi:hypothetical protein